MANDFCNFSPSVDIRGEHKGRRRGRWSRLQLSDHFVEEEGWSYERGLLRPSEARPASRQSECMASGALLTAFSSKQTLCLLLHNGITIGCSGARLLIDLEI